MGWALTGELLVAPAEQPPQAALIMAWLAQSGHDQARLQQLRQQAQAAERVWPWPIPADLADDLPAAQRASLLAGLRQLAGLTGLQPRVHRGPKVIGPAEQRLLAERPPHHGNG